ncbi:uncharacterized protein LOC115057613 [Echeneis naucrates]|uniref:uncharacterized protein LOC115057613 n=1 Tax=Echeneis naucrates TaxID=173247 RepID=UPI0011142F41|nr:uncharacterized protein LOC115057613 [Echeneis naucrates]
MYEGSKCIQHILLLSFMPSSQRMQRWSGRNLGFSCPSKQYMETSVCPTDNQQLNESGAQCESNTEIWTDESTRCFCTAGQLSCSPSQCPKGQICGPHRGGSHGLHTSGMCTIHSHTDCSTFDGVLFRIMGTCTYVLAKTCSPAEALPVFSVEVVNEQKRNSSVPTVQQVTVDTGNFRVSLLKWKTHQVVVNGVWRKLPLSLGNDTIRIRSNPGAVALDTSFGLSVSFDSAGAVHVILPSRYSDKVCGICGNFNNLRGDDFYKPDGTVAQDATTLTESWRTGEASSCETISIPHQCDPLEEAEYASELYCGALLANTGPFAGCQSVVGAESYFRGCVVSMCSAHGDPAVLCEALQIYTDICYEAGADLPTWRNSTFCPFQCGENSYYNSCADGCPEVCSSQDLTSSCGSCVERCECDFGFKVSGGKCVPAEDCGCWHNGKHYEKGETFLEGQCVRRCQCTGNNDVQCTAKQCAASEVCKVKDGNIDCFPFKPATCRVYGDPHYITFDRAAYNFQGGCSYTLATTCGEESPVPFTVIGHNMHPRLQNFTRSKLQAVTLQVENLYLTLNQSGQVYVRNSIVRLPYSTNGTYGSVWVYTEGGDIILKTSFGLRITLDGHNRLFLQVDEQYKYEMCGLCGTYSGYQDDDFVTPDGQNTTDPFEFGNSWRVPGMNDCVPNPNGPELCDHEQEEEAYGQCYALLGDPFRPCHELIHPSIYIGSCVYDYCATNGSRHTLCESLKSYAAACQFEGVELPPWQTGTACADLLTSSAVPTMSAPTSPTSAQAFCPMNCDFERNLCGWKQLVQDSFDWSRHSGPTPSHLTGPNQDHTTGAGFYMYIEGDSVTHGDSARLMSSVCHYNGPLCLHFWYHMYGSATAMALNIYLLKGNKATKLWSKTNNQGPEWHPGNVDIGVLGPFQIIVEAIRGFNALSDVAIDDVSIHFGSCSVCNLDCSFGRNLCSWNQMLTDAFDWTWHRGPTLSLMTGPSSDHTGDGHYLYIEASGASFGDMARLISSECSDPGPQCLQFWYHMYGSADTMGLHVYLLQNRVVNAVWRKHNDQGNMWHLAQVDLTTTGVFQIIFEGRRGSTDQSDVAIDDISLHHGHCSELATPTSTATESQDKNPKPQLNQNFQPQTDQNPKPQLNHNFQPQPDQNHKPQLNHNFQPQPDQNHKPQLNHNLQPQPDQNPKPQLNHNLQPQPDQNQKPQLNHNLQPQPDQNPKPQLNQNFQPQPDQNPKPQLNKNFQLQPDQNQKPQLNHNLQPQPDQNPKPQLNQNFQPQPDQNPKPQLNQNFQPQPDQNHKPQLNQNFQPQLDQNPKPQLNQNFQTQPDQNQEPQLNQNFQPQPDQNQEPQLNQNFQPQPDRNPKPQLNQNFQPQTDQNPKPQLNQNFQPQTDRNHKPQLNQNFQPQTDQNHKPQLNQNFQPQLDWNPKPQLNHNHQPDQNQEPQLNQNFQLQPDQNHKPQLNHNLQPQPDQNQKPQLNHNLQPQPDQNPKPQLNHNHQPDRNQEPQLNQNFQPQPDRNPKPQLNQNFQPQPDQNPKPQLNQNFQPQPDQNHKPQLNQNFQPQPDQNPKPQLNQNFQTQPDQNQEPQLNQNFQPQPDQNQEPQLNQNFQLQPDRNPKPQLNQNFQPQPDQNPKPQLNQNFQPQTDRNHKPQLNQNFQPQTDQNHKPQLNQNFQPQLDWNPKPQLNHNHQPDQNQEPQLNQNFQPQPDQNQEPQLNQNCQTQPDQNQELHLHHNLQPQLDWNPKPQLNHNHQPDQNQEPQLNQNFQPQPDQNQEPQLNQNFQTQPDQNQELHLHHNLQPQLDWNPKPHYRRIPNHGETSAPYHGETTATYHGETTATYHGATSAPYHSTTSAPYHTQPRPPTTDRPRPPTTDRPRPPTTDRPRPPTTDRPRPPTTDRPQSPITTTPQPQTTARPKPPTTVQPQPSTTDRPRPPTTDRPQSPITTTPQPQTTARPKPPTTAQPRPPTTDRPQPPTTAQPLPPTTDRPQPSVTTTPQPQTTARPKPPTTPVPTPSCPENTHYTSCVPACSPTCANVNGPPGCIDSDNCVSGCVCDDGFVQKSQHCVPLRECGCVDTNGTKHQFNDVWYTNHCSEKCECKKDDGVGNIDCDDEDECDGNAICLQNDRGEYYCQSTGFNECTIKGDPEYKTFDKAKHDFEGEYSYVLVRTKNLPNNLPDIYIECSNRRTEEDEDGNHRSSEESHNRTVEDEDSSDDEDDSEENEEQHTLQELKIKVYNHTVEFKKNRRLLVNGRRARTPASPTAGLKIKQHSSRIYLKTDFGLSVEFDGRSEAEIILPQKYKRKVQGLCGNFDGQKENDWVKPDGSMAEGVQEFGESWRV